MKILFFIDVLTSGGKERRLTELMKGLKQRPDFEFELALMSTEINYREVLDLDIPIHYLIRKTKRDFFVFRMLYSLAKDFQPDIIHCWGSMTAIYCVPVCKLLNIKLVNGLITDSPSRQNILNKNWFRARITFPFSDLIVGNSKAGLDAYRAPEGKSFFIHNGFNFERTNDIIDNQIIKSQLNIGTKYVIGMVANYSKNKDYATYFAAAQLVLSKRKDITFIAIGINTDSPVSQNHIGKENIGHFRLLGMRSGVESYINSMDLCILSTFTEGISNSILEYMALGKPVIATSGGGTNEIVVDNETGFLINRSNPDQLAEKIEILLDDNELRAKMGVAGKKRIENLFSINSMVRNYVTLYNKILSKSSKREKSFVEMFVREALAIILIQVHYIFRFKHKGILSIYFHNPSKVLFEKILKWLLTKGYRFISIQELDNAVRNKLNTGKLIFICFDDGWKGNLDLIEVIEKYKVPITIFITTNAIEEGNYWWEYALIKGQEKYSGIKKLTDFKKLPENTFKEKMAILKHHYCLERSCITSDELKKMSENKLITIGSHTVSHPILTKCSYETQARELKDSRHLLSQFLMTEIEYLAYPNGSYDKDTIELAEKSGYKLGLTTNPGDINVGTVNPYTIPRNALYDSGGYFENISKILGIWQKIIFNEIDDQD
jgi:glycosyltransferase involved in cell wall biosynthesis/peptidoglycan/xylan/chitin deacetylase (PgdA/CDA1 family)